MVPVAASFRALGAGVLCILVAAGPAVVRARVAART